MRTAFFPFMKRIADVYKAIGKLPVSEYNILNTQSL